MHARCSMSVDHNLEHGAALAVLGLQVLRFRVVDLQGQQVFGGILLLGPTAASTGHVQEALHTVLSTFSSSASSDSLRCCSSCRAFDMAGPWCYGCAWMVGLGCCSQATA